MCGRAACPADANFQTCQFSDMHARLSCFTVLSTTTTTTTTDRPNSVPKESPKVSQKGNQSIVFLQPIIVWIRGSFLHFPTLDSKILTYLPQPRVPPFFYSTKTLTSERKKNKDERNYKCKIVKNQSKRRLEYALIDEHTKGAGSAMSTCCTQ